MKLLLEAGADANTLSVSVPTFGGAEFPEEHCDCFPDLQDNSSLVGQCTKSCGGSEVVVVEGQGQR
jgi:hypothetical protein